MNKRVGCEVLGMLVPQKEPMFRKILRIIKGIFQLAQQSHYVLTLMGGREQCCLSVYFSILWKHYIYLESLEQTWLRGN